MKHAVVLLSGGLDSATVLAIAKSQGYETYALSFDYGQRHKIEIEAARKIAKSLGAREHRVIKIDSSLFSTWVRFDRIRSMFRKTEMKSAAGFRLLMFRPETQSFSRMHWPGPKRFRPPTFLLERTRSTTAVIPIARPEFIALFETLANAGTKAAAEGMRFQIHAPLIKLSKAQIVSKSG